VLRDRLLFGPLFIVALIGLVWGDQAIAHATGVEASLIFPAVLLLSILAASEFTLMVRSRGVALARSMTLFAVALGTTVSSFTADDLHPLSGMAVACTAAGLVLFISMVFYTRDKSAEGVVASCSATVMGFVYIGLLSGFLVVLTKQFSGWLVLGVLLTTKSCDIGAYFTGRAIGKHKLIEWLSPKKTWEGLAGGVITSTLVGSALLWLAPDAAPGLEVWHGAVLGCVFGFVGQAGDLMASLVKRDTGFKDASQTLPGFGGVLDVVDSPLLVAPVAYWLINMFSG